MLSYARRRVLVGARVPVVGRSQRPLGRDLGDGLQLIGSGKQPFA